MGTSNRKLIAGFDCTQEYSSEKYFGCGDVKVVETAAGSYREAEGKPLSRFGYRFRIEHIGKPHMAVIRYPEDKRRYMCIMDGTSYDLNLGIFSDFEQSISGKMEEVHQIFWPRWNDCSIVFMTWGKGEPAAVSSIDIYELDDLPVFDVPGDPGDGSRREIGIQYEDSCGTGASEGATSHEEWEERVVTYLRHSGQNMFIYPIAWYHGPQLPFKGELCDDFDVVIGQDRKQYIRWTIHPEDWLSGMLEKFDEEGLEFIGSLTLMRLGSLMQKMNTDLDSIKAGADTINNMLWNDNVQAGTQDWTPIYNVRNYTKAVEYHEKGKDMKDFPWAYGEKAGQPYPAGPIFNPLHPTVQDAIIALAGEICTKYAHFRSFKGISFNMWHTAIMWFGSIHAGYDDYTVRLFENETGIKVPVDIKAHDRFSKRYDFLTCVCRSAWIDWRCKKIHQLFCKIRDAVVAARPDMSVIINFWNEMSIGGGVSRQLYAKSNAYETCLEAGLDINLFRDEEGIGIDWQLAPSRDRAGGATLTDGAERPAEHVTMHRDHDFLDRVSLNAVSNLKSSGAFIFNSWVEAWGEHKWFSCDPDDMQAQELAVMNSKPAEGIFRINSEYPEDGFWWDSQLRITPAFPSGVQYMEHYAHAVAELDACRITRGGLFMDKAHTEQIREFALAYRALPAEKFETVGSSTDPVVVRTLVHGGKRYFYLINREYYPVKVELTFSTDPGKVIDLTSNKTVNLPERWNIVLAPYGLQTYKMAPEVNISAFIAYPPRDIVAKLIKEGQDAIELMKKIREAGHILPGMDYIASGIKSAIEEKRYAWLRRALNSYVVLRSRELEAI